ncbi:hypothetical protein [Mycoplasmopsis caviae]|uniref:Uncharacterized protein n=1 Tax=Mycoplasmopsis caviae TaxID=55603 RepID=A0A3P8KXW3_9BACT|nr:hypothetical protein [Mycoplasmopsis caviae]VDR42537.1 Uncharacterised protein [Mycoplasmopsis caviae]
MEKLKLHSEWNEVEEFAKQSSENLTNLKTEQYISKRNEVIDSFIKIKTHINKLREESINYEIMVNIDLTLLKLHMKV